LKGCLHPNSWGLHYDPLDYNDPTPVIGEYNVDGVSLTQRYAGEISVLRDIMEAYYDDDLHHFNTPDATDEYKRFMMNGYIYGAQHIIRDHSNILSDADREFLISVANIPLQY